MSDHKTRSLQANSKMWAMLSDLANQVVWYGQKLTKEEWKEVTSAALKRHKVVPGIDRQSFVCIGMSTRKMSVAEMNDLITLIEAFGIEQNVRFTAPEYYEEMA